MKNLDIIGLTKRFFSLIKLFQKRKQLYIIFLLPFKILLLLIDIGSLAAITPFITILLNPNTIHTNKIINQIYLFLEFTNDRYFIATLGLVTILIFIFGRLASYASELLQIKIQNTLNIDIKNFAMQKIINSPYEWYLTQKTGEIQHSLMTQCGNISGFISSYLTILSLSLVLLVVLLYIIISYPLIFLFFVFFICGIGYIFYFFSRKLLYKFGLEQSEISKKLNQLIKESVSAIVDIRLFSKENYYTENQSLFLKKQANLALKNQAILSAFYPFLQTIMYAGILLHSLYIIIFYDDLEKLVSSSVFFLAVAYRGIPFYNLLISQISNIQSILYDVDDLDNRIKIFENIKKPVSRKIEFNNQIMLQDIWYSYPNAKEDTIKGINVTIDYNDCIGIVGKTGSGKSTLVKILLGLLEIKKGKMLVDGKKFTEHNLPSWYKKIAFVSQRTFISSGDLIENIAFGEEKSEIDKDKIDKIINLPWLKTFINNLPKGINTRLEEEGLNLSGGQIQRIAIARAIYKEASIIVFDEATNSLDLQTEKLVLETIENLGYNKTLIIIAHRLTTLKNCNKIYSLENGRAVCYPNYETMLKEINK